MRYGDNAVVQYSKLQCPCTRDCEGRSATCHSECEAFLVYESKHLQKLDENFAKMIDNVGWYWSIKKKDDLSRRLVAAARARNNGR